MSEKKWLLGYLKQESNSQPREAVYLRDFKWECGWYWAGGYIGNRHFHAHFDGAFLDMPDVRGHPLNNYYVFVSPWHKVENKERTIIIRNGASIWESLSFFLDEAQYSTKEWWRIKDLFKQFYALKAAAEVLHYGGHCTSERNPQEIKPDTAKLLNQHIETVIIPEIRKALDHAGI